VRFLVDNALSPILADDLRRIGHDATHVRNYALQEAEDEKIFALGKDEIAFYSLPILISAPCLHFGASANRR
jgi:predicted nuclease of predicted toxin-antitoxin system